MKKIRSYHIEHYWAEQAEKRRQKEAVKARAGDAIMLAIIFALEAIITWGFCDLLFSMI
jgi:hypothetical protein